MSAEHVEEGDQVEASKYVESLLTVLPGEEVPSPDHDEHHFCRQVLIKKKGRKKKDDPENYQRTYVPWEDINDTELVTLALFGDLSAEEDMRRWNVVFRGRKRSELIGIIREEVDPIDLQASPLHDQRDRTSKMLKNAWRYINTQLKCNTLCWECNDAKVLECVTNNQELLKSEGL